MDQDVSSKQTAAGAGGPQVAAKPRAIRVWPGALLVAAFWSVSVAVGSQELPISITFMSTAGACALLALLYLIWWLTNRTVGLGDRLWSFLALILGATAAIVVSQQTLGTIGVLLFGLPAVFTAWTITLFVLRRLAPRLIRPGLIAVSSLLWIYFSLLRMDGLTGDLKADIRWRWSPRDEDVYLAERSSVSNRVVSPADANEDSSVPMQVQPGDWSAYRGPGRNGEVRGLETPTDWNASPPKLVWRQKIGPAWSSMLVIGGRLYTQEQVGESEAVVCLDAATGRRLWSHEAPARFWDSQSGAGPRATPAFADGFIYAQGATGMLNCLDAVTGKVKWSQDIMKDSGAPLPMWGFSSTPLVSEGMVIVYAGGKDDKGLLAYRADDGKLAWTAAAGPISYSSPRPAEFGGKPQVMFLSDHGLVAVEPATGKVCWKAEAPAPGIWRAVQPVMYGSTSVLAGSEDLGTVLLNLNEQGGAWDAKLQWMSKAMKPAYNDFVVHDGFVYGFDGGIFCCLDLKTGKRRWKGGRYGHGQTLLLADQGLLLISAETGEAVLLEATPEAHRELGRFQAIEGKTWNHPAIANGCLFIRNGEEIACYRLQGADGERDVAP